jgi:hypothetical protein
MARLYGRAGRLTTKNGGYRPLVPPPVWSTIYLLQKVTSPRFTILNDFRPRRAVEPDADSLHLLLRRRTARCGGGGRRRLETVASQR